MLLLSFQTIISNDFDFDETIILLHYPVLHVLIFAIITSFFFLERREVVIDN